MSTRERTDRVSPMEKFTVLASDVDAIRERLEVLAREQSVDDLLDVVDVESLGKQYGVSRDTMKRRLVAAGGRVFKMGKRQVIRKIKLVEVMEVLEHGDLA